jgi:DNA-binding NtrC family response regulator
MPKERILVVDDQEPLRAAIELYLTGAGYEVFSAGGVVEAAKVIDSVQPHGAILDYSLPDGNGLGITEKLLDADPNTAVIILTAHGSIDLAVQAVKLGAEQFLTKPVELKVLEVVLRRALTQKQATRVRQATSRASAEPNPFIGQSAAIQQLQAQALKLAGSDRPILIAGETGTGKTILARWLHENSSRAKNPFIDLNCAGFARELLESELFGYEKGAFTGAVGSKQGLLEVANRGTVFLDEIGDMDIQLQPKLLKVLEEKRFRRVGDARDRHVDIRLMAASHRDLSQLCRTERFRSDLYFRISTLPVRLAPLRERKEDIPLIAEHLLDRIARELGRHKMTITPAAWKQLVDYPWPGNIRELKNVVERAVLLKEEQDSIGVDDLSFDSVGPDHQEPTDVLPIAFPARRPSGSSLADVERRHIETVLTEEHGQVSAAAKRLGIARGTLYAKLKEFNIYVK